MLDSSQRQLRPVYLVLFLMICVACQDEIRKEQLIGRYTWNDARRDTLEIRADGRYEYWAFIPGERRVNQGRWTFDSVTDKVEFQLENFPFLENHAEGKSWFSQARVKGKEIRLMLSAQSDSYMKQVTYSK